MPRQPSLNWDARRNKWTVVYQGKKHRFDGGTGKSDREALRLAQAAWKGLRVQLDHRAELAKPHRVEYQKVMDEWDVVLACSLERGEETTATLARSKLASLRERFDQRIPPPLDWADRFLAGPPPDYARNAEMEASYRTQGLPPVTVMTGPAPSLERLRWHDESAGRSQRLSTVATDDTLAANVEEFLDRKRREAKAKQRSIGRAEAVRRNLEFFLEYAGPGTAVQSINHSVVAGFREHLLERIQAQQLAAATAKCVFTDFKMFVRWLSNHAGKLEHLPKNLDDRSLTISVGHREVQTLQKSDIHKLLKRATPRTQLYILLGLNAAMTQKDVSDLRKSEVDWSAGTIARKRSKTRNFKNVPQVIYRLWPETLRLLREQCAKTGDTVLLNRRGKALKMESYDGDNRFKKADAVRSAMRRLSVGTGVSFSVKHFKKTAASLLRNNQTYSGLESLYLDHAPSSVSDRHYAAVPQDLLNDAIQWLGNELGLMGKLSDLPEPPARDPNSALPAVSRDETKKPGEATKKRTQPPARRAAADVRSNIIWPECAETAETQRVTAATHLEAATQRPITSTDSDCFSVKP